MLIRSTWGRYGGNTVVLPGHYRWNTLGAPGSQGTGPAGTGFGGVCYIVSPGAQPGNVTNASNGLHPDRVPGRLPDVSGLAWKRTGFTSAGKVLASPGLSCDKNQRHWTPSLRDVTAVGARGSQAG